MSEAPVVIAERLADVGRRFYARGWVLGTSGNFCAVVSARPLRLWITPSGAHKGTLAAREYLRIDGRGRVLGRPAGRPSAETALHLEIVRRCGARAVLHTHSVWSTILSDRFHQDGGLAIEGLEMLKGLEGVHTHHHREWLPIVGNDQDMRRLAAAVRATFRACPGMHGFLIRGHGLYTWGQSIAEAERHVEIFEFLLDVVGRSSALPSQRR